MCDERELQEEKELQQLRRPKRFNPLSDPRERKENYALKHEGEDLQGLDLRPDSLDHIVRADIENLSIKQSLGTSDKVLNLEGERELSALQLPLRKRKTAFLNSDAAGPRQEYVKKRQKVDQNRGMRAGVGFVIAKKLGRPPFVSVSDRWPVVAFTNTQSLELSSAYLGLQFVHEGGQYHKNDFEVEHRCDSDIVVEFLSGARNREDYQKQSHADPNGFQAEFIRLLNAIDTFKEISFKSFKVGRTSNKEAHKMAERGFQEQKRKMTGDPDGPW